MTIMKCTNCGHEMNKREGTHRYEESGLKNVLLINVPIYRCPSCKETDVEIPRIEELHRLIGSLIVLSPEGLKGEEARYLRKQMGYTAEELAEHLGVSRLTVTRWETGKATLRPEYDKHLRRVYLTNQGEALNKLPAVNRMLTILVDRLPIRRQKKDLRIRTDEWAA